VARKDSKKGLLSGSLLPQDLTVTLTVGDWPRSDKPFMALPEDDLQALGNLSDARHKAEDTTP